MLHAGYFAVADMDFKGPVLRSVGPFVGVTADACDSDSSCRSFNSKGDLSGAAIVDASAATVLDDNSGVCLYVKQAALYSSKGSTSNVVQRMGGWSWCYY